MSEEMIFWADGSDAKMIQAFDKAQQTFRYFWRELYWEYRRIIPALDMYAVKIAFIQEQTGDEPLIEHMWINNIGFDGELIYGVLINEPNYLSNVKVGDEVSLPLEQVSDWLFATQGKTYGGFSIQAIRSEMNAQERQEHDDAWGLDFADFNTIYVAYDQEANPEVLLEHPMCVNSAEQFVEYFTANPDAAKEVDEGGNTLLHNEAIAGNSLHVKTLLAVGADKTAKNSHGKTALDYAKQMQWDAIVQLLEN